MAALDAATEPRWPWYVRSVLPARATEPDRARDPAERGGSSRKAALFDLGTPAGVLALQRAAGNRAARRVLTRCVGPCHCGGKCDEEEHELLGGRTRSVVRTLARKESEHQFALAHDGQVESVQEFVDGEPQLAEEDVDEFVLWNFLVNSDVVRKGHNSGIDGVARRWAAELTENPLLRIRVLGYASVTGGTALNEDLARRRAETVRDHLAALGVPLDQIVIDSSGSRLPMDEGDSSASLARNRRVEISKFVASTVKSSLSALATDISFSVRELDFTSDASMQTSVSGDEFTFQLANQRLALNGIRLASSDPNVEIGFIQFVTNDVRLAGYSDATEDGEVIEPSAPPSAFLNYQHCMDAFGHCRDVRFARLPFSQVGGESVARPSPNPSNIVFDTAPKLVLPSQVRVPGRGNAVLTQVAWKMSFKIVVCARNGALLVPGGGQAWELAAFASLQGPSGPGATTSINIDSAPLAGASQFPDIERAMSMPSCNLRTGMMNKLCKPTQHAVSGPIGEGFDEELKRAQEELRKALERLRPDL